MTQKTTPIASATQTPFGTLPRASSRAAASTTRTANSALPHSSPPSSGVAKPSSEASEAENPSSTNAGAVARFSNVNWVPPVWPQPRYQSP